jgi:hypothetical protein
MIGSTTVGRFLGPRRPAADRRRPRRSHPLRRHVPDTRQIRALRIDPKLQVHDNPQAFLSCVYDPARALCHPDRTVRGSDQPLVLVAPMIPAPGEAPARYWTNTGYDEEPRERYDDEIALFYHDVPPSWPPRR